MSLFDRLCVAHGLFEPVSEYAFAPPRKWRFDWAWPERKVAVEIEGGIYGRGKPCPVCKRRKSGAHSSVTGLLRDIEKYNRAASMGWRVLRATPDMVEDGSIFPIIVEALDL